MSISTSVNQELHGYFLMIGSIIIFSLLPYYIQFLAPVDGNTLFSFRVLSQLGFGFLFLAFTRQLLTLKAALMKPKELLLLCFTSPLIGLQGWILFWGAVNGETINIAMGYFLLPITISLTGRFYFKENLSWILWLAVGAALIGVSVELFRNHSFSWVTLLICFGFPPYFILRQKSKTSTTSNFVAENILLTPLALLLIYIANQQKLPLLPYLDWGVFLLLGSGFLASIAMLFFVSASTRLRFTVFGMLNYGEPLLMMMVAIFLLNESINQGQLFSYSFFGLAVLLVISDSLLRIIISNKKSF